MRTDHWLYWNSQYNRNCLVQFHEIPWNQTTDVHRGSTLITRAITCRWRYKTWQWRHKNHVNTIKSVIAAKQTVINEVYVFSIKFMIFSIKYRYAIIYWKIHKVHLFCWLNFFGWSEYSILLGLNPHAAELISVRQFRLIKWSFLVHSTTRNAPYIFDSRIVTDFPECSQSLSPSDVSIVSSDSIS